MQDLQGFLASFRAGRLLEELKGALPALITFSVLLGILVAIAVMRMVEDRFDRGWGAGGQPLIPQM
ncbi:MAG: hypothetical protein J2P45_12600 [Candidatus Dormibacteraeota bacterium]|nr:hypothetical protein [Candidatus Dormibacteraeota bacterium]